MSQKFEPVEQKERSYGPSWATFWFKVDVLIPEALDGKPVVFQWDVGCEGLVWSSTGEPLQGLTGGSTSSFFCFPSRHKSPYPHYCYYCDKTTRLATNTD